MSTPFPTGPITAEIERSATVLVERSATGRAWHLPQAHDEQVLKLAQRLDLPEIVARILIARQIDLDHAVAFLEPRLKESMPNPNHLLGMEVAVNRLLAAVTDDEPIGLIGDYDADGATSTAMLSLYLESLGATVVIEIPDRLTDGYGPNTGALNRLAEQGCQLVLTLDSGTTAFEVLAQAASDGQEVIVVDHHQAEARLPQALAIINPNRQDQVSPLGDLAAVGVTFMLIVAINAERRRRNQSVSDPRQWLDLVAVGTVCDVVPLLGLNRAFVHQGLKVAARTHNTGLKALCEVAAAKAITDARQLGFAIGPRINAAGRLGRSPLACQLLRTTDESEASGIAGLLDGLNKERQSLEQTYLKAAKDQAQAQIEQGHSILILAGDDWHQGVVGIVASRMTEQFHRPSFVIGWHNTEEGPVGKGSGRSIEGIDLGQLVIQARQDGLLVAGGGHAMAAGLTIAPDRLEAFGQFAQAFAPTLPEPKKIDAPPLRVEAQMSPAAANLGLVNRLDQLAPFGNANPEPRLVINGALITNPRPVGRGHVSCQITSPAGGYLKAIAFRADDKGLTPHLMTNSRPIKLAGKLRRDTYGGREQAQFEIEDLAD